jgi:hypothetical protein
MAESAPPADLLRDAGLAVHPRLLPVRAGRAWLADWQQTRAVLRALPVFLYGRGLQMIARRAAEGNAGAGMLAQVRWIADHAAVIADAAARAAT